MCVCVCMCVCVREIQLLEHRVSILWVEVSLLSYIVYTRVIIQKVLFDILGIN